MTRVVVVVRRRTIPKSRPYAFAGLSLLMAVAAAINLGIGIGLHCYDSYCDYRRRAYIISGSCFVVSSVCFLIAAITLHIRIKKAIRMNQARSAQQAVTVSPEYPAQPVVSFPAMPTQYPPPYPPPTGPTPYPLSPGSQYPPPVGFAANSQPTESYPQDVTQPPPYSP